MNNESIQGKTGFKIWGNSNFYVSDINFMVTNRNKLNIWQPCDINSGNPIGSRASKISPINFSIQSMG